MLALAPLRERTPLHSQARPRAYLRAYARLPTGMPPQVCDFGIGILQSYS